MLRVGKPFEQNRFGCRKNPSGRVQALEGDFFVPFHARSRCTDRDMDLVAGGKQIQRGLHHAHMGFDACQHQLPPTLILQCSHEHRTFTTTKSRFFHTTGIGNFIPQNRHGRPQTLGVLFGDKDRDRQQAGRLEQNPAFLNYTFVICDGRDNLLLHINQDNKRLDGVQ